MGTIKYTIDEEGNISFVWRDELIPLIEELGLEIKMSPKIGEIFWRNNGWYVNLEKVGGPILGPNINRSKVVEMENIWAEENLLSQTSPQNRE